MNITVAKTAGFCFGVDRAVKMVESLLAEGKKVCTLGPLIHNPGFIAALQKRGVVIASSPEEIPSACTLVIRTHGVSRDVRVKIDTIGCEIVDATCPFVKKIQQIADRETAGGAIALIAGDPLHPEVVGIRSYCHGLSYVCSNFEEFRQVFDKLQSNPGKNIILVSQTTFSVSEYEKYINYVKLHCTNVQIFATICNATSNRQSEALALSLEKDAMIIVGGRNSSNTRKLYEVCRANCPSYLVESAAELKPEWFVGCRHVGITAGASTPDSIIKEVRITMSENTVGVSAENLENETEKTAPETEQTAEPVAEAAPAAEVKSTDEMAFADALEESLKSMNSDQKVVGTVMSIQPNEIQVDIGRKQTGYIPIEEYSSDPTADPAKELKVGDEIHAIIMKTNDAEGTVMLSKRRYDASKYWDTVVAAYESKEILEGKVTEVLQKGVIVHYNGIRVFIPASQSSVPRSGNLETLKDQVVSFRIIDIDSRRRRAVGSIKSVADERRAALAEQFWADAFVGKKLTGTVKNLTTFAAFVDLGGAEGMIHRSELSWRRIKHPSDVVNVGDTVEVTIKSLDPEKKKVSLSYRKIEDNPWEILKRDYPVDSVVDVKIVGLTDFGAFAQIFPGMDGLIHISQIADRRIAKPSDVLSVDDTVKVKITGIDFDKKRISLSIRALLDEEKKEEKDEEVTPVEEDSKPVPIEEYAAAAAAEETAEDAE